MKYLQDYKTDKQSACFKKYGAFFAFSQKQFDEKKVEGEVYINLGVGFITRKKDYKECLNELDKIHTDGVKQDQAENSKESIILRELANHECYYTGEIDQCVDTLEDYAITKEEIKDCYLKSRLKQIEARG